MPTDEELARKLLGALGLTRHMMRRDSGKVKIVAEAFAAVRADAAAREREECVACRERDDALFALKETQAEAERLQRALEQERQRSADLDELVGDYEAQWGDENLAKKWDLKGQREAIEAAARGAKPEPTCPECGMHGQHKLQCSRREDGGQVKLSVKIGGGERE